MKLMHIYINNDLIVNRESQLNSFDAYLIDVFELNKEQMEKLYNLNNVKNYKKICIKTSNDSSYNISFIDNSTVDIVIDSKDLNDSNKFYNYLTGKGYKINSICCNVSNMDYLNINLSLYEEISKKTGISFDYGAPQKANFEDFKGLVETIKWYRGLIQNYNLSPAEKVMYAYDIMKTFSYKEEKEGMDKSDSRNPHRIIASDNIVCTGYTNMLIQILKGIDNNIKIGNFSLDCYTADKYFIGGHSRNIVELHDDKYNIHGSYILDATWDSYNSTYNIVFNGKYSALDLYRYFLIPPTDYKNIFPNDTVPDVFLCDKDEISSKYKSYFDKDICLLENMTNEMVKSNMLSQRISLEAFNQMLYNVRVAEGYTPEQAQIDVVKVDKYNHFLMQQKNKGNEQVSFFEEYSKGVTR